MFLGKRGPTLICWLVVLFSQARKEQNKNTATVVRLLSFYILYFVIF